MSKTSTSRLHPPRPVCPLLALCPNPLERAHQHCTCTSANLVPCPHQPLAASAIIQEQLNCFLFTKWRGTCFLFTKWRDLAQNSKDLLSVHQMAGPALCSWRDLLSVHQMAGPDFCSPNGGTCFLFTKWRDLAPYQNPMAGLLRDQGGRGCARPSKAPPRHLGPGRRWPTALQPCPPGDGDNTPMAPIATHPCSNPRAHRHSEVVS